MTNKVDFGHLLQRRRFSVGQWLESEQISTQAQLDTWCQDHQDTYELSPDFLKEAKLLLDMNTFIDSAKKQILAVSGIEPTDQQVENVMISSIEATEEQLPVEESESKTRKSRKNQVNNPPKDD